MVMSCKASSRKPAACEVCQGTNLVRRITTYPVHLTGPLEGKQIHVGRVALHECQTCGHLMPTPPGRPRWTVMAPWESASSSGSCTELSRPTHAYRKVTADCKSVTATYPRQAGWVAVAGSKRDIS